MRLLQLSRWLYATVLLTSALFAFAQRGAIVTGRNLAQLTAQAETIVVAHVAYAHVERHPQLQNLYTVVVTLRVSETLKGVPQETLTFRQFIWDPRDIADGAAYHRGDEVLLLLNPVNEYHLTSPAGLNQGRFELLRDTSGRARAMNGYGNRGLFDGMSPAVSKLSARSKAFVEHAPAQGAVALDDLRRTIRELVATQGEAR